MSLPAVLVHVRITTGGVDLPATEALRDAIVATVAAHADVHGVRLKRRVISLSALRQLFQRYEDRAKLHDMVD